MRHFTLLLLFLFLAGSAVMMANPPISDDLIYDQVRRKLADDPDVKGGAFQVDVKDGVVTIKGVVVKEKFRRKAETLTRKVKGVKSVVNNVVVKAVRE